MRHSRHTGCRIAAVLTVFAAACREPTANDTGRETIEQVHSKYIARSLALALEDQDTRDGVLRSFRASPYVMHKLFLQDFVATPAGRRIAGRAAAAVGATEEYWLRTVGALPRLEFSVPRRADRLTWRGTDNVAVALVANRQLPSRVYTAIGSLDTADARRDALVVIRLAPAGSELYRSKPQRSVSGSVIQDADDGEGGVQYIRQRSDGTELLLDLMRAPDGRMVVVPRSPARTDSVAFDCEGSECCSIESILECPGDDWNGAAPRPWTYIDAISGEGSACDGWICAEYAEYEFVAEEWAPSGVMLRREGVRITGVWHLWAGQVLLIASAVNGDGRFITVYAKETDLFFDDRFDPVTLRVSGDYGVLKRFSSVWDLINVRFKSE
jgi:hypothetical protein